MVKSYEELLAENELLHSRLEEATDTLEAIRTGQIDALVVNSENGHALYTLQSADHSYRVFVEQMAEGAVSLNSEGLILFSNSQFAKIVDTPLSKVVGKKFSEFVDQDEQKLFDQLINEAWINNVKHEIKLATGNGVVYVQVALNSLRLQNDPVLNVIVTDLTIQKQSEKQLTEKNEEFRKVNEALISSNHDLQQFASVASHDLQEPLRKIQVFSNFLQERSQNELSDASKDYVEKIVVCARRMKVLIVDILTYSKLSAEDNSIEQVDLDQLFEEILEDFDLKIGEKHAVINLNKLCAVEGNRGQLRQVFHNLVSNALKFVSPDRTPTLSIECKDIDARELGLSLDNDAGFVTITVKDNGIGFDDKYASSIFNLFEKLNPKTTYDGSGIGLSIAKKIIDKHHGVIIARSTVGLGSEFNVVLPLTQPKSN